MSIRAWIISDSHSKERMLKVPYGIEMVIHAGDAGTYKSPTMNANGVLDFLSWYRSLDVPHKIFVAGNHDGSIEAGLISKNEFEGIHYLQHEAKTIAGLKFFGSPYSPSFNNWAFNVARHKLGEYWKEIPDDTDILITHGPPAGVLDLTINEDGHPFQCGCKSLWNRIKEIGTIKHHVFGHIHPESGCPNAGILKINGLHTTFINACVVNLQYNIENNGFVIDI